MLTTVSLKELYKHPALVESKRGLQLVPINFLSDIAYKNASDTTDLGDGSSIQYQQSEVWRGIKKNGMRDPFYVIIGRPNPNDKSLRPTIRLESGNHRIKEALKDRLTHLPCMILIQSYQVYHPGNGDHLTEIDPDRINNYYKSLGRSPSLFEPYPHPACLKTIFPELDIFYTSEIFFDAEVSEGIFSFYLKRTSNLTNLSSVGPVYL